MCVCVCVCVCLCVCARMCVHTILYNTCAVPISPLCTTAITQLHHITAGGLVSRGQPW